MASGGAVHLEKEWDCFKEQLICVMCGDLYNDPRIIPCLHTFCKQCIEKSIESNSDCPLCHMPIPQSDPSLSPTNLTVKRLVETFGKLTVAEFVKNPKLVLCTPENCKIHSNQPLYQYCKTCSSLLCQDCLIKDHVCEMHDINLIENVVDEEREKIKQAIAPFEQLLEQVRNVIKRIEESDKEVDIESEANRRKIRGAYGEVYKLLKQQEEEALEKVNTIKMSLKKTLAMQKENVKLMESQLVSCVEFSNDAILTNEAQQVLTCKNTIFNRMDYLTKQVEQASIDPECSANDMIVACGNHDEFIIGSLCHVSGVPHLPHCSVRGPLKYSDPVKITVTLKDANGLPVVKQSQNIKLRCNKEEQFLQNIEVSTEKKEESDGVYHIWYNPKRKEDHLLSVYWRGLVVNDDEVKVPVNIRDYANIKRVVKVIDDYGQNNEQLKRPFLLAKGPNNEIIVRNNSTQQLVIFDEQLQYSHVIGGYGNGNGKFKNITGIAVDNKGYLYVADSELHCIQRFVLNGQFDGQFGSEGTAIGQFIEPYGLAFSKPELLFVCDCGNHRIQVFRNEHFSYAFGMEKFCPFDLTLNSNEDLLFVTDTDNNRVQVFTPSGQFKRTFKPDTDIPFQLKRPIGIYYTADNHLLISSWDNHCVLVFEEDGRFVSAIEGTYEGSKRLSYPCGVIMMNNGQIVIASYGRDTHKLVMF